MVHGSAQGDSTLSGLELAIGVTAWCAVVCDGCAPIIPIMPHAGQAHPTDTPNGNTSGAMAP
jgi:hypothetical protein